MAPMLLPPMCSLLYPATVLGARRSAALTPAADSAECEVKIQCLLINNLHLLNINSKLGLTYLYTPIALTYSKKLLSARQPQTANFAHDAQTTMCNCRSLLLQPFKFGWNQCISLGCCAVAA